MVEIMRKTVYIASPYTEGNKTWDVQYSLLVAELLIRYSFVPFTPLLSHFWNEYSEHDYEYWMQLDLAWLERCDMVLRLPGKSQGADREVWYANELGLPIYFDVKELIRKEGPYL